MNLRRLAAAGAAAALLLPALGSAATPHRHPANPWLRYALDRRAEPAAADLALDAERERALRDEGHGFVERLLRQEIRLERDGTLSHRFVHARRYLTENGVHEGGNLIVGVAADRATAVVEAAYALAPDGTRLDVDLATVQVETSERSVFSDARELVPCAALRPGATAVLVVSLRESLADWPLPWSKVHYLQSIVPIERYEVDVEWAPGAAALALTANDPGLECRDVAPRHRSCLRLQTPALAVDPDVQMFFDLMPQLVVSTARDWSDVAAHELPLVQRAVVRSPELERTAQRVLGQAATPLAKLQALQRFVADEVRYVGLEHGPSAVAPHPAGVTLERRYGDCKDKVALFLALAHYAGLDAHATLVATDHYALERMAAPASSYFDHMIACVDGVGPEGRAQCVDLTDPYTPSGQLSTQLVGAVALDVVPGARLRELEFEPFLSYTELRATNRLECDGAIDETVEHRLGAHAAMSARASLRGLAQPERRRWAEQWHRSVMGDRFPPEIELRGVDDGSEVVAIRSHVRYAGAFAWPDLHEYSERDAWLERYIEALGSQNHTHAYHQPGFRMHSELDYELCSGHSVAFGGPELAFRHEFGSLVRRYEKTEHGIRVISDLELPRRPIAPADLPRFKRFLELLADSSAIRFSLRRGP